MPSKSHDQYSPTVKGFIPMIYVAWADGLLSPSEVRIIREQIQSIPHLTPIEKKQLFEWIEPSQWPDQETFKQWMNLMKETGSEIDLDDTISIVDLGLAMAKRSSIGQVAPNLEDLERVLQTLQDELKLPAPAKFRALHASHVEAKTQASGPPSNELQRLLDGDSYDLKMRMRKLLSDPVFEREVMREKDRYRNKVRQWLVLLAEQGFGALGYPEAYGGEGDIIKYAAVFEMLAHFDLSLAVKFGVQFGLFGGSVQHLGTKM
ncbi:MAG: acyl-CoA dehydrogenase family protein, partial [Saprospiraceae bacterium]|nr:acyl-CoA dehydrogenase family protein [Saprospiraceae bacterium]